MQVHTVEQDISVLADVDEVPGIGYLPINAFVLRAAEPVVVDTGQTLPGTTFLEALGSVVDPADVRWIWLTHPDRDHTGALFELLEAAPRAKVITTFLGAGILSLATPLPMDRVYFLNPGEALDVGDRTLHARTSAASPPATSATPSCSGPQSTARGCTPSIPPGSPRRSSPCAPGIRRSC